MTTGGGDRARPGVERSPTPAKIVRLLDAALLLAAFGVLAATIAALGAKTWWRFELFTHFRLHYVLLALPLCVGLAALGRRHLAVLLVLAAVPNLWPLLPYLPVLSDSADARAAEGETTIELMAANVEWRNAESERLLEMIRAESPDAVLVAEFTESWQERLEPIFADYPHRVLLPDSRAFGIALLSRLPLRDVRPFRLESTYAIDARIVAPRGELRLIGVHLRPPTSRIWAAERAHQLDTLARLADGIEGPLAIAGDFNLTPYSPYFSDLLGSTGLRDSRAGSGPGFTWPSFLPVLGIPIDHCLVSPELGVAAFRRLPAFGSDHYPIVVELIMEGEQ